MTDLIDRRDFLAQSSRLALSSALVSRAKMWSSGSPLTELEKQLPRLMAANHVPGVSLAVLSHGGLAERRVFGLRDATSTLWVDEDTMYTTGFPNWRSASAPLAIA